MVEHDEEQNKPTSKQQAESNQQGTVQKQETVAQQRDVQAEGTDRDTVEGTIGGRNAAQAATPLGDRDASTERHPEHQIDPMMSRDPKQQHKENKPTVQETEIESPWRRSIRGEEPEVGDQQ